MATLPDASSLGARPNPQPSRGIAGYDGGASARALGGLAQVVGNIGEDLDRKQKQITQAKQRADAALALSKVNNDFHDAHDAVSRGVFSGEVSPDQADGLLTQKLDELKSNGLANLSDEQRSAVADNVETTTGGLRRSLAGTVFKRQQSDVAVAIDQFGEQVQRDVPRLGPRWAAEKYGAFVDFNGGIAGLAPATQEKLKQSFKEAVSYTHLEGLGADAYKSFDIPGIDAVRKMVRENDALDPAKKTRLDNQLFVYKNTLESQADRLQKQSDAEAARRLKEATSATEELRKFVTTGAPLDAEYQNRVLETVQGTALEPIAKTMMAVAAKGAGFGAQSLPAQAAQLRGAEAVAAKGTNPDSQAALQYARTVHDNQTAAYKDNPWAAATRFGGRPEQPEQQITSPTAAIQVVEQRTPLMNGVEERVGAPVSPLQPNEAAGFVKVLKTLPPEQAAEMLGKMGTAISDNGRINALAEQVGKGSRPVGLALKQAGDQTTAGLYASRLTLLGAQGIADKLVKKDDTVLTGWRADISAMVRGTLGNPQDEQDVIETAYFVRAAMDMEGAAAPGFKFASSNEDAVAMVIGRPIERGGVKTVLPRGMKEGEFDDALSKYDAAALTAISPKFYSGGQEVKPAWLAARIRDLPLKRWADGVYVPLQRNRPITLDPQGQNLLQLTIR